MKRFNRFLRLGLLSTVLGAGLVSNSNAAPHGHMDYDGKFDLVAVQKFGSGSVRTRFHVRLSSTNTNKFFDFAYPADATITQRKNGLDWPGVVYVEDAKKPLIWSIAQPNGTNYTFRYGNPGDDVPAQGDFNGNGIDDIVVIRNVNGFRQWFVAIDGDVNNIKSFAWGLANEPAFVFNDQVQNVSAAYVLRNVGGTIHWISRTLDGVTRDNAFGVVSDIPLGVENFYGGTARQFAVARRTTAGMKLLLGVNNSTMATVALGTNDGIPFVSSNHLRGFYGIYDRPNALTAIANLGGPTTFVQHGGSGYGFLAPSGLAYPVGVGAVGLDGQGNGGGGNGGNGGGGGPPVNFAGCTKYLNVSDGHGKGFTWNPNNSRRTGKVILDDDYLQDYTVESVKFYNPDGSLYRDADFAGYDGYRHRWYTSGKPSVASHPKNMVIVIKLLDSPYYNIGTGLHCAVIPDPKKRYD